MRRLALILALAASSASAQLTPHQQLARSVYQQLVETNTVDSVGSVTDAVNAMATRFRAAGFPAADVQVLIPPGHPAKGNLVVRYRGRANSAQRPLLLLAHLDVVAAHREDWVNDPFKMREENGFFLGRGVADDKAMASIFVANLLRMKAEKVVPDRDLILALTADEEGGDMNGVKWLVETHRDLIDAEYAINEGGGGSLDESGRPIRNSIQAAEKVSVNFTLTSTNRGGHSSQPRPDNAIYALAAALTRISQYQFPVVLNQVTRPFFTQSAIVEPRADMAAAMRAIVANPADSVAAATLSRDPNLSSTLRTSCVATRLSGGHAYNALPQLATANVNCRIEPTSSFEYVQQTLQRLAGDSIKVTFTLPPAGKLGTSPNPVAPDLLSAVNTLTRRMWGDIPVIPSMSTGATDGMYLRAGGIPTYGVSGIFSQGGENNAHGLNEKLRVKSYYEGLEFLDQLVRRLAITTKM